MPGIGRLGQAELIVACLQLWLVLQCLFYHLQAQVVVEQVGSCFLEWVHGRDHEPHFIQAGLLAEAFRQCDVAGMDGVESYRQRFLLSSFAIILRQKGLYELINLLLSLLQVIVYDHVVKLRSEGQTRS